MSKRLYALWFIALVFVAVALLLSVLRAGFHVPAGVVSALNRDVEQRFGLGFAFEQVSLKLDGRVLALQAQGVQVIGDQSAVELAQLAVRLNAWASVRASEAVVESIALTGLVVDLADSAATDDAASPGEWLAPLSRAGRIRFDDVKLTHPQFDLVLSSGRLISQNGTGQFNANGELRLAGRPISVEANGELNDEQIRVFVAPQVETDAWVAQGGVWLDLSSSQGLDLVADVTLSGERTDLTLTGRAEPDGEGLLGRAHISGVYQGQAVSIPDARLRFNDGQGLLETGPFNLPGLSSGLLAQLPNPELAVTLEALKPAAVINNAWFEWGDAWRLHVDAREAKSLPRRNIPGGAFDARVSVDAQLGVAELYNISSFHSLRASAEPSRWEDGRGRVIWQRKAEREWLLVGRGISLQAPDTQLDGEFRLRLKPGDAQLGLLLEARAERGHELVPEPVLPDDVRRWWQQAAPRFATEQTRVWVGSQSGQPLDLQISGSVNNASLNAMDDWPRITGLVGDLNLYGRALEAAVTQGALGTVELTSGRVTRTDDGFEIQANARLPGADLEDWAAGVPIDLSGVTDNVALEGMLQGALNLRVPVMRGQVEVSVDGAETDIKALNTGVSNTQGRVVWDLQSGLQGGQFTGSWQGQPVQVDLAEGLPIALSVQGRVPLGWATRRYAPFLDDLVSGSADFQAQLNATDWQVEASLQAGQLTAPVPLNQDGLLVLTGQGDALQSLRLGNNRLQFGSRIQGELEAVDWLGWAGVFSQANGEENSADVVLSVADGRLGELSLGAVEFTKEGDRLTFAGGQVQAEALLGQPIQVSVENLELFAEASEDEAPVLLSAPADVPDVDLSVKRLVYNQIELFNLASKIRSTPDYLGFNELGLTLGGARVVGTGRWSTREPVSEVDVNLDLLDLGEFMQALDLGRPIETRTGSAFAQLSWPGVPWAPNFKRASGQVQLETGSGRLTEGPQAAEALRLFGVLNLSTLTRRLNLDFSDLLQPGLAFDRLQATASLREGQLTLTQPLRMEGPGATFELTGQNSLATGVLDHELLVQVPLSAQLPAASLLAGFPAIAAGVILLVERAAGEGAKRFGQSRYDVTGTFEAPEIKPIRQESDS